MLGTSSKGEVHSAEHNLELLKPLDAPVLSKKISYNVAYLDKIFAEEYFKESDLANKIVFGVIPAGGWDSKRCDKKKWLEICEAAIKKFNCKILILWGPGDESDSEFLKQKR